MPEKAPKTILTLEQCRMVRESFESVRLVARPVGLLFYGKLFELDPSVRSMFHVDLALQVKKLMDMLSSVVEALDNFESIRPKLEELGRKHATYGVRPEQYKTLATALLWTFNEALGADFDARTSEAWRIALTTISTAMTASTHDSTPGASQ
jgi:hemoglobin-like flavoprotein